MRLFDSHTHVQAPEFDGDRDTVIERGRAAGLAGLLVLGWDVASSERALALAERHAGVLAAAGCHPHSADEMDGQSMERLAELAADPRVSVVGEIGLDFYRNHSTHDNQVRVFERELEIAAETEKPVAIHCREAQEALFPIVRDWARGRGRRLADGRPLGVMHYFDGDVEQGRRYVEMGFVLSIHCSVTYPKAARLQQVARELPLEALVVETDSPFGPPQSRRGKRNEPAYVIEAVERIAELRGDAVDDVAEITAANALRLFGAEREAWARSKALPSV